MVGGLFWNALPTEGAVYWQVAINSLDDSGNAGEHVADFVSQSSSEFSGCANHSARDICARCTRSASSRRSFNGWTMRLKIRPRTPISSLRQQSLPEHKIPFLLHTPSCPFPRSKIGGDQKVMVQEVQIESSGKNVA
jgi:hypothetical protein